MGWRCVSLDSGGALDAIVGLGGRISRVWRPLVSWRCVFLESWRRLGWNLRLDGRISRVGRPLGELDGRICKSLETPWMQSEGWMGLFLEPGGHLEVRISRAWRPPGAFSTYLRRNPPPAAPPGNLHRRDVDVRKASGFKHCFAIVALFLQKKA